MNPRHALLLVIVLLVVALAWWVLDGEGEAGPLEGAGETRAEEEEGERNAAPEVEQAERDRAEADLAPVEHDQGHGEATPDFGALVDAVGEVFNIEEKRTIRFSGQVVHRGTPVPGAQVVAQEGMRWGPEDQDYDQVVVDCDAAGRFEGELEVRRNYVLTLSASAYQLLPKDNLQISYDVEGEARDLVLELFPATEFHGVVTVKGGSVVEGATVQLHLHNHWSRNRAGNSLETTYVPVEYEDIVTEVDGRFSWPVPEGDYQVEAEHDQHGRAYEWKISFEECPLDLELDQPEEDPKSSIVGTVFGPDGRPKSGATVLFATNGPRTTTDENGEFVLEEVAKHWALDPEVVAWAEGCAPVSVPISELTPLVGPLRIDLPRGGMLAGIVIDEEDNPVSFTTVRLNGLRAYADGRVPPSNELSIFDYQDSVQTDTQGRFRFDSVPPRQLGLAVGENRFDPDASVLAMPDNDQIVIRLGEQQGPSVTVAGRVIDATTRAPLAQVKVQINLVSRSGSGGWSATSVRDLLTDENGMYRGEGLPTGEYYYEAILTGYARGKTAPQVEEEGEKTLDFELYPERTVRVVVRKADGSPASGVSVTIKDASGQALMIWSGDGSGRTPATTDDKGIVLAHKMPGGPATVEVQDLQGGKIVEEVDWSGEGPHELIVELEI